MPDQTAFARDPYNLDRFMRAQIGDYDRALTEIEQGQKRSHWMWFVFPQLAGLGTSATAQRYAVRSADEARAYLHHPVLGPRLGEGAEVVLGVQNRTAAEIFGHPDDFKLRSSATLFAAVSPPGSVFERLLGQFFGGEPDLETVRLLGAGEGISERRFLPECRTDPLSAAPSPS